MTCEAVTINGRKAISKLIFIRLKLSWEPHLSNYKVEKKKKEEHKDREKSQHETLRGTGAVKGCFTHKQKGERNAHIAWGFLFYFLARRDRCYVGEQTKCID